MNIDEKIELVKQYIDIFDFRKLPASYNDLTYSPETILDTCKKLKALGMDWGDPLPTEELSVRTGSHIFICSPQRNYKFVPEEYYVVWGNPNGRYAFINNKKYYSGIDSEWDSFEKLLLSYKPLDWDIWGDYIYVYDIEHGKKLIKDYPDIRKQAKKAIAQRLKELKIQELTDELEKLKHSK